MIIATIPQNRKWSIYGPEHRKARIQNTLRGVQPLIQPYDLPLEQLEQYTPPLNRPADFIEFWKQSRSLMAAEPLEDRIEEVSYPATGVVVYRVEFRGFAGARIRGWYADPTSGKTHPGLLLLHGYNWNLEGGIHDIVNWALHGYASFGLAVRGQQDSGESVPSPHGHAVGWMTQGILDPKYYYYRGVYLDALRAVEWLSKQSGVAPDRIGVVGGSQGGGLALAVSALSDQVKVAVAEYPFLCHFRRAVNLAPAGPYGEINEFLRRNGDPAVEAQVFQTLSYFDVMNLAPWIQCPVLVSTGLIDQVTPPSTIFAAYHHIGSPDKAIRAYRYFGHESIPRFHMEKLAFLMQHLES